MRGVNSLKAECLRDPEALFQLEREWRALWLRVGRTPFQSPDWILPWWRAFGEGEPWILTLRHGHHLIAFAPLYVRERRVFLIGTGNSDYLDVLVDPYYRDSAREGLFRILEERSDEWDWCDFQQLREDSALMEAFAERASTTQVLRQEVCPVLDLSSGAANAMLERARAYRKKLESALGARLETATRETAESDFRALLQLHGERWKEKGMHGVLTEERDQRFHREVIQNFVQNGMLRLHTMRSSHAMIAVLYGFHHHDRTYYYLSGFDPAFGRYSPGTVIVAYAIERAIQDGAKTFDFLRGAEAYKYRWGARDQVNFRGLLWQQ